MNFEYASEQDRVTHSVMKKVMEAGGVWQKAGHFYNCFKKISVTHTPEEAFDLFAIDLGVEQKLVMVNGLLSHTSYGSRSKIPWLRAFVVDAYGVVTKKEVCW